MSNVPYRRRGFIDKRRDDVKRVNDMTVHVTRVSGRILVVGSGEATVDVPFPVIFSEKPNFGFGGELEVNFRAVAQSYPTVSAVVVGWDTQGENAAFEGRFIGCTLAIVTGGPTDQQMWVHYSFEGKAMRNPLGTMEDDL